MSREVKYYVEKGVPVAKVVVNRGTRSFPVLGILTIIFVVAKLFDKLDWSWFMVFWPLWIIPAIFIGIVVIFFLVMGIVFLIAIFLDWLISIRRKIRWRMEKRRKGNIKQKIQERRKR